MPGAAEKPPPSRKSGWDKLDVVLRPVGGLLTAMSVALVGFLGTRAVESGRALDSNMQLYAQLMSSREDADSALRQGMFNTIMSRFLSSDPDGETSAEASPQSMNRRYSLDVLRLEMLAYNFHDSLDLAPLFQDLQRRLTEPGETRAGALAQAERGALLDRLERVASEVIDKQISSLDEGTNVARESFGLDQFEQQGGFISKLISRKLSYSNGAETRSRAFSVDVVSIDRENESLEVRLTVWDVGGEPGAQENPAPIADVTFEVGFFDFPMVDNTRLGGGDRCAVVLNGFGEYEAQLSLVYFPGSRASLKEKQYYDDIVRDLRRSPGVVGTYN